MSDLNSVVTVFKSHDLAGKAIRELQKDGFDISNLSIVGKNDHTEEHVACDQKAFWGELGAFGEVFGV